MSPLHTPSHPPNPAIHQTNAKTHHYAFSTTQNTTPHHATPCHTIPHPPHHITSHHITPHPTTPHHTTPHTDVRNFTQAALRGFFLGGFGSVVCSGALATFLAVHLVVAAPPSACLVQVVQYPVPGGLEGLGRLLWCCWRLLEVVVVEGCWELLLLKVVGSCCCCCSIGSLSLSFSVY